MTLPAPLSRREVLTTAATLGVTAITVVLGEGEASEAAARVALPFAEKSGLITGQLKPMKYTELPGLLSKEQLAPHYIAHYGGALRNLLNDEQQLEAMVRSGNPLSGPAHAFLHKDKLARMNSVLLHELYFDGLTVAQDTKGESLREAIIKRFGSFDRWLADFKGCCMAANGWGLLAREPISGKLFNVPSDAHEVGVVWFGQPLIVCDVYEHAYYVDYQNSKREYVDKFAQFLDWDEAERRFQVLSK